MADLPGEGPEVVVPDWTVLLRECTGEVDQLLIVLDLARELADPGERDLLLRLVDTAVRASNREPVSREDWDALLRACADGVEQLRRLYDMVRAYAPQHLKPGLLRRVEAAGRAARKKADRLAAERGEAPQQPRPATAPSPVAPVASTPAPVAPVPVDQPAGEAAAPPALSSGRPLPPERRHRGFELDEGDEFADFAAAVRYELELDGLPDVPDERVAQALAAWHDAVAVQGDRLRFVSWTGWTGICLAMWLAGRYPQMGRPEPVPSGSRVWALSRSARKLLTFGWLDQDVRLAAGRVVCEMDVNAQFLAAARSALCGDGEPIELDAAQAAEWDQLDLVRLPGYVVLASPPDLSGLPRHAVGAFAGLLSGRKDLLPNPLAVYLVRDHGVRLDIGEAVVWHTRTVTDDRTGKPETVTAYGKRLAKWAEVLTDGRAMLTTAAAGQSWDHPARLALTVLKRTYSKTIGSMLRSTRHNTLRGKPTGWLRPDWYDQVIATASANLLRSLDKAAKAGWTVLGGLKDSVWLVADGVDVPPDPDIPAAPVRRDGDRLVRLSGMEVDPVRPGRWKLARHAVVDGGLLEVFGKRRPQPFRKALGEADQARRATSLEEPLT